MTLPPGPAIGVGMLASGAPLEIVLFGGVIGIGVYFLYQHRRKQALAASVRRLLSRMPGWQHTNRPCGITRQALADRTAATPRGDRRFGIRHGIGGPLSLAVDGRPTECEAAFFEWFSEQRSTSRGSNGTTNTSYRERREVVGIVRLPVATASAVRIDAESLLGRFGITREGEQVESSEFNRRFRVEGEDRVLTVQFLDANLQQVLLESFQGRSIDLDRDVLVLGGSPNHRDDSLTGVVGDFPAVRQDMERLVAHIPAQFWRALGAERSDAGD